jgi:hypothetical protein
MWRQVFRAIMPALSFGRVFENWRRISARLAEPPRERTPQILKVPKTS